MCSGNNRARLALQMFFFFLYSVQKNLKVAIAVCEIIRAGKSYFEGKSCPLRSTR